MSGRGDVNRQQQSVPPMSAPHIPVLLSEVVTALAPQAGEVMVDGTFGAGGYSRALLEAADCAVIAIDCDPDTKAHADDLAVFLASAFPIARAALAICRICWLHRSMG